MRTAKRQVFWFPNKELWKTIKETINVEIISCTFYKTQYKTKEVTKSVPVYSVLQDMIDNVAKFITEKQNIISVSDQRTDDCIKIVVWYWEDDENI